MYRIIYIFKLIYNIVNIYCINHYLNYLIYNLQYTDFIISNRNLIIYNI